jgi:hypothetical protein
MVAGYRSDVAGVADHLASVAGVYPAMIHGGVYPATGHGGARLSRVADPYTPGD